MTTNPTTTRSGSADRGSLDITGALWLAVAAIGLFVVLSGGGRGGDNFAASYCGGERHFGLEGSRPGCPEGSNQPAPNPSTPVEAAASE